MSVPIRSASGPRGGRAHRPLPPPCATRDLPPAAAAWLSVLRHELKTPLAGLLGLAEQLHGARLTPERQALLHGLTASARHLAGMIDRLVPDAGPKTDPPGPAPCRVFDGHRLLESVLAAHWPRAAACGIALHLHIEPGVPARWSTAAGRLRQILDNLLSNALDATDSGHVLVRVRPAGSDREARYAIELSVEDTGCGLGASHGAGLYGWRVRGARGNHRPHGEGIGLFVCRWLCAELGGRISHAARAGGGTVFRLVLPVASGRRPNHETRLRPRALRGLVCRMVLPQPGAAAVAGMLQRIGIRLCAVPGGRHKYMPDLEEILICEAGRLAGWDATGTARPAGLETAEEARCPVVAYRLPAEAGAGGVRCRVLPLPALRASWEPILLDVALALRATPARAPGAISDTPD